ncbi:MAG TPA: hypothetical protein GXZ90_02960 [Clostridiales bacterium]|nr:hypothetical protein [Clostridiales bacterium]
MNISKKTIKKPKNVIEKKQKKINKWIPIVLGSILITLLVGLVLFDQFKVRTMFTIDKDKYSLNDLRYYFYVIEAEGKKKDETYQALLQRSYWDSEYNKSPDITMREYAKSQVLDLIIKYNVLYREALKNGYALTDQEKIDVEEKVDLLISEVISESEMEKNNFTRKYLQDMTSTMLLVDRFQEDLIKSFNIDYEAIKSEISFEEYRQYDLEYLFVSKNKADDAGNILPLDDSEKSDAHKTLEDVRDKAAITANWFDLLSKEVPSLEHKSISFIKSDGQLTEDIKNSLVKLNNSDMSDILEDDNGYYLFKMIENKSTARYDKLIEDKNAAADLEAFAEYFEDISSNYHYSVNIDYLRSLRLGNFTID